MYRSGRRAREKSKEKFQLFLYLLTVYLDSRDERESMLRTLRMAR